MERRCAIVTAGAKGLVRAIQALKQRAQRLGPDGLGCALVQRIIEIEVRVLGARLPRLTSCPRRAHRAAAPVGATIWTTFARRAGVSQCFAHASISRRRFSNRSPRR